MTTLTMRRTLSVVIAALLLGPLAACGSEGGGSDLPDAAGASSDGSGSADDSDTGSDDEDISAEDAMLKFAACMRENGIDMPDPEPGEGIRLNAQGMDEDQLDAAHEACQKWMELAMPDEGEGPGISPEDKQAMLDMAKCMRERGYEFPDPEFDGGRIRQRVGGPGFDPDDPAFQTDTEECQAEAGMDAGRFGMTERES